MTAVNSETKGPTPGCLQHPVLGSLSPPWGHLAPGVSLAFAPFRFFLSAVPGYRRLMGTGRHFSHVPGVPRRASVA